MLPLIPLDPAAVGTMPSRLDRLPDELQLEIVRLSALSDDGAYNPFQLRRSLDELCERRPRLCDDSDGLAVAFWRALVQRMTGVRPSDQTGPRDGERLVDLVLRVAEEETALVSVGSDAGARERRLQQHILAEIDRQGGGVLGVARAAAALVDLLRGRIGETAYRNNVQAEPRPVRVFFGPVRGGAVDLQDAVRIRVGSPEDGWIGAGVVLDIVAATRNGKDNDWFARRTATRGTMGVRQEARLSLPATSVTVHAKDRRPFWTDARFAYFASDADDQEARRPLEERVWGELATEEGHFSKRV
eukprot:5089905-Prymnesium_polylepis.1